jgi:hypothetical protein
MKGYFIRTKNKKQNFLKATLIVLLFAFAHAVVCYFLHDAEVGDGLFLTVLTITMIFCLIRFYGCPFDVFLGLAFLGCFAGFYFGTTVGDYLTVNKPELGIFSNMLVTFITTCIIGLSTILIIGRKSK